MIVLIQGHKWYLVLWKGYSKEEASWVPSKDITSLAIRYTELKTGSATLIFCFNCYCRLYNEPEPCLRVLLDDNSSLRSALQNSLKSGIICRTKHISSSLFQFSFSRQGTVRQI